MVRLRSVATVLARLGELTVETDPTRPSGRLLREGNMDASYVDLADVTHLEFEYMRWLRIVLRAARARRIVHVGGGACALARALAAEWPAGRQEVCELDGNVLELARAHMGLRRARGLHVRHADGRAFLAGQPDDGWDAVVIDAFLGARVPHRLVTAEAFADVARVAPLALVNVVDDRARREVAGVAAGLATAYRHVWTLGSPNGNVILAGADAELPLDRIAAVAAADPYPTRVTSPSALERLVGGTPPLRDGEP